MKTILIFALFALLASGCVQRASRNHGGTADQTAVSTGQDSGAAASQPSPTYTVAEIGLHHRVWQSVISSTNHLGKVVARTNSYTELETGMHHLVSGQWVQSSEEITLTSTGAEATNSQHRVAFLGNINSSGAVHLTTPDGKNLISSVLGLSYWDAATGKSVMIAQIKDSNGELLPTKHQALYPNAFTGLSADVLYNNTKAGLEQDIILKTQPPSPIDFGMDPATTWLQVLTEFLNPPAPRITPIKLEGADDEYLDFGVMQMGQSEAFAIGNENTKVPVTKQWTILDGRNILLEQVLFRSIQAQLQALPPTTASLQGSPGAFAYQVTNRRTLPPRKVARKSVSSLEIAAATPQSTGVILDYAIITSQTNVTFQSDSTYYLTNAVTLSGTDSGEAELKNRFKQATAAAATQGLYPADIGKEGASCKSSSSDILGEWLLPTPKCWKCTLEHRNLFPDLKGYDHQTIICTSYPKEGHSKEIIFDWWGDVKNKAHQSGGSPNVFRSKWPYFNQCQDNPFYTQCDGSPARPHTPAHSFPSCGKP